MWWKFLQKLCYITSWLFSITNHKKNCDIILRSQFFLWKNFSATVFTFRQGDIINRWGAFWVLSFRKNMHLCQFLKSLFIYQNLIKKVLLHSKVLLHAQCYWEGTSSISWKNHIKGSFASIFNVDVGWSKNVRIRILPNERCYKKLRLPRIKTLKS